MISILASRKKAYDIPTGPQRSQRRRAKKHVNVDHWRPAKSERAYRSSQCNNLAPNAKFLADRGGGAREDTAAHSGAQRIEAENSAHKNFLPHGPVLRMQRVIVSLELDYVFLSVGQQRGKWLAGAQAWERLFGSAAREGLRQARGLLRSADGAGVLATVGIDAAQSLWVALGGVAVQNTTIGRLCDNGAGLAVRRACCADFLEALVVLARAGAARAGCRRSRHVPRQWRCLLFDLCAYWRSKWLVCAVLVQRLAMCLLAWCRITSMPLKVLAAELVLGIPVRIAVGRRIGFVAQNDEVFFLHCVSGSCCAQQTCKAGLSVDGNSGLASVVSGASAEANRRRAVLCR
jgi:hypothetical protein